MPRKKYTSRSNPLPDSVHGSLLVTKFISSLMSRGKRSTAERVFYQAMSIIEEKTGQLGITVFKTALANAKPVLEVKSRRVGGATYQVPMEVTSDRRTTLAIRWILGSARERSGKSFPDKLASELIDASNETGASIRKRDETHKMAEANRAFSHYRI